MGLTWEDIALWIAGLATLAALFLVLVGRKRAGQFPFFTILVGFDALQSAIFYFAVKNQPLYFYSYWGGQAVDFLLQIAVVVEIALQVFKPFGTWAPGARSFWIAACAVSLIAALGLTIVASPHAPTYSWAWVIKGNLFAIMLTCMIAVAVLVTARRYGLGWRNHVMGLAQGWTFWAFITFVVETFHSYFGYFSFYGTLARVRVLAGIAAQVYWIFIFWQEEPSRVVSPERHKFLVEQQRQLGYYVDKLVSRSDSRRSS